MPDTVWVHGTTMQAEYTSRLSSVRPIGPFARIEGSKGQNTWVHFPVPTPPTAGNGKVKVGAVLLNFRTRTDQAWIHEVVLYDGATTVAEYRDLHLNGDHPGLRFEVPNTPEVQWALNVTVGVMFASDPPSIGSLTMEFNAAGCEFIS